MSTSHKHLIAFWSASSQILSFELTSNNLASIVQIKATNDENGI